MKKKILIFFSLAFLFIPLTVFANGDGTTLFNPIICDDLLCLFMGIIRLLLGAIGVFALFIFMWGGFLMLTSGGNAEQVKKAKDALLWASIGIVTILSSWVIVQYLLKIMIETT